MKSVAQRKADERRRKTKQGLKRVEEWVPVAKVPALKKYATELRLTPLEVV